MSLFYVIDKSFDKMHFTCNWVDLGVFNTSRNKISRSSVEVIQVYPRNKLNSADSLKLDRCSY